MFAVSILPIAIMLGAAVDLSRASTSKSKLQSAVDAAVLAGMAVPSSQRNATAKMILNARLAGAGLTNIVPSWAQNGDGSFTGVATATMATSFLAVTSLSSTTIPARATAALKTSASANKVCILVMDPNASQALLVNSNVTLNATHCQIDVASTASPPAIFNAGDTFNVSKICLSGNNPIQNGGSISVLSTGCAVASNTFCQFSADGGGLP